MSDLFEMNAGPELDALVAAEFDLPPGPYSSDLNLAFGFIERRCQAGMGGGLKIEVGADGHCGSGAAIYGWEAEGDGPTFAAGCAHALCLVMLRYKRSGWKRGEDW